MSPKISGTMPAGLSVTAQRRWVRELCKAHGVSRGYCKLVSDGPQDGVHDNVQIREWQTGAPGVYCVWIGYTVQGGYNWKWYLYFQVAES